MGHSNKVPKSQLSSFSNPCASSQACKVVSGTAKLSRFSGWCVKVRTKIVLLPFVCNKARPTISVALRRTARLHPCFGS